MRSVKRHQACPCGSHHKFRNCCAPYVSGESWPPTAESLMRSRYTAYVTGAVQFLYRSTHPENEAVRGVSEATYCTEMLAYCEQINFRRLTLNHTWPEDGSGMARVLFTAEYEMNRRITTFAELSEFLQVDGKWLYHTGSAKGG